jgi:hypothetical protein
MHDQIKLVCLQSQQSKTLPLDVKNGIAVNHKAFHLKLTTHPFGFNICFNAK